MTTKPFEVDPDAAADVLAEAQRLGRFVHLNSPTPVMPVDLQQVLDWRDRFDLGRPVGCRLETYASYHEQADGSWLDDPERCPAAPIFRLGIYLINMSCNCLASLRPCRCWSRAFARVVPQRTMPNWPSASATAPWRTFSARSVLVTRSIIATQ